MVALVTAVMTAAVAAATSYAVEACSDGLPVSASAAVIQVAAHVALDALFALISQIPGAHPRGAARR